MLALKNRMIMRMISFAKLNHRHLSGITFEIKTTMKDKFGPNATPLSGKLTEIQVDYKKISDAILN